jgi:hypothetical protein
MTYCPEVLSLLRPGAEWRISDGVLIWLDVDQVQPTDEEYAEAVGRVDMLAMSVEMRQAKITLLRAGLLDAVDRLVASLPGDDGREARIQWEYAVSIRRDFPMVEMIRKGLGLSVLEMDDLFRKAKTVV